MARLQTLHKWAVEEFGDAKPSPQTLKKYAKLNMIYPPAVRVGRHWMVEANARYVGMLAKPEISRKISPLARRILMDGQ
ncbi:excisionase [Serratia sp. AS12]|uniref:excisionase n=1 Tax=Serratia TaxID=613 RepID=UPI00020EA02C|nr:MULTISPECIES: excisionase [Serratia]AEF47178.1 excisionase [Serratia plymuthica AS9]AEF52130.1 excisionase [Serratia sp. AS12]AEG29837.1 excisionase [Serratia sp. AS13]UTN95864.1 excisionase [Serratia plymuthica]